MYRNSRNPHNVHKTNVQIPTNVIVLDESNDGPITDTFKEVILFVEQLYREIAAERINFSNYSCIFCNLEYYDLQTLIGHIEDYHRQQILDGNFDLEQNFEELIRRRILYKEQDASGRHNIQQQQQQQQATAQQQQQEVYQCAKCLLHFLSIPAFDQHLGSCGNITYYQPQPVIQQQQQQQPVIQQATVVAAAPSILSANSQRTQPVIQQPSIQIPSLPYGCARCGQRFTLVRDLTIHLNANVCSSAQFPDADKFLLPRLWVQAPENQHILINEDITKTVLKTTGVWLMSDSGDTSISSDVPKGFWIMPPPPPPSTSIPDLVMHDEQQQQQPVLMMKQEPDCQSTNGQLIDHQSYGQESPVPQILQLESAGTSSAVRYVQALNNEYYIIDDGGQMVSGPPTKSSPVTVQHSSTGSKLNAIQSDEYILPNDCLPVDILSENQQTPSVDKRKRQKYDAEPPVERSRAYEVPAYKITSPNFTDTEESELNASALLDDLSHLDKPIRIDRPKEVARTFVQDNKKFMDSFMSFVMNRAPADNLVTKEYTRPTKKRKV